MVDAAAEISRALARSRVGKDTDSQELGAGGAHVPPVFPFGVIRRALRYSELAISLQPTCPYNQDVLVLIDDARDAIRSLEHQADMIAGLRMSGSDIDQLARELLVAMGSPQ
jgi:hypothetical protein